MCLETKASRVSMQSSKQLHKGNEPASLGLFDRNHHIELLTRLLRVRWKIMVDVHLTREVLSNASTKAGLASDGLRQMMPLSQPLRTTRI
jgi:hypothetical protein